MFLQKSYHDEESMGGCLYLVPTPIGNLGDMTYRAVDLLKRVDMILAEDTRNSLRLLKHFEITTPMASFHEFSGADRVAEWVQALQDGCRIALISDAGMPLINDPGHPLVQGALAHALPVIALPGANAALTALIASGLVSDRFTYYGFFPKKKREGEALLDCIGHRAETAILYETPHRIEKTLSLLETTYPSATQIVLARELTKKFEEYLRGTVEEVVDYVRTHPLKGEIVLLIEGQALVKQEDMSEWSEAILKDQVQNLVDNSGVTPNEAIKQVAKRHHLRKQAVYNAYHDL